MTENVNEDEILDRITAEHYDRGHLTGPIAGCQACLAASRKQTAELEAARAQLGGGGAAAALEQLAMAQAAGRPSLVEQVEQDIADDREPATPLSDEDDDELRGVRPVTPLVPRQRSIGILAQDGATLRDLADTSVRAAMDCLDDPHARAVQEAIVHALVASVQATLAVEETIRVGGRSGTPGAA